MISSGSTAERLVGKSFEVTGLDVGIITWEDEIEK